MKVTLSAFIVPKSECESVLECQDSFSISKEKCAFAVADGVSGSLVSQLFSSLLTKMYIENSSEFFLGEGIERKLKYANQLKELFDKSFEVYYKRLDEDGKMIVDCQREKYVHGAASTFVGVRIEKKEIIVDTIGDSVLYTFFDGIENYRFCSSMANGHEINFGTHPEYITSSGFVQGVIKNVHIPVQNGHIYVMTDGLAEWFFNLPEAERYDYFEILNNLSNHKEFVELIREIRKKHKAKDDDMTFLNLKIEEAEIPGEEIIHRFVDDVNLLRIDELESQKRNLFEDLVKMKAEVKCKDKEINILQEKLNSIVKIASGK